MLRLLYYSTAYADISAADVYEIATRSSEANIENKITGALAFDGKKFCQCLEGKHESVQNLIETIRKDGRNSDLEVIAKKPLQFVISATGQCFMSMGRTFHLSLMR